MTGNEVEIIVADAIAMVYPPAVNEGWLLPEWNGSTKLRGVPHINVGAIPQEYWYKIAEYLAMRLLKEAKGNPMPLSLTHIGVK